MAAAIWVQTHAKNPDNLTIETFSEEWFAVIADILAAGFLVIISIVMGVVVAKHYQPRRRRCRTTQKPRQLAVLIDLDPLEPVLLGRILDRAADHGTIGIRRAYGNRSKISVWRACLQYHDIEAARNYGTGTNAADITLIIDAADMLHTGKADGFCIVAGDHHFTGLINWLQDQKVFVAGIGGPKLRDEFGGLFTDMEDLREPDGSRRKTERDLIDRIKAAIRDSPGPPTGYVRLSVVKSRLGGFEPRVYCHGDMVSLLRWYGEEFDVVDGGSVGLPPGDYVRVRPSSS